MHCEPWDAVELYQFGEDELLAGGFCPGELKIRVIHERPQFTACHSGCENPDVFRGHTIMDENLLRSR